MSLLCYECSAGSTNGATTEEPPGKKASHRLLKLSTIFLFIPSTFHALKTSINNGVNPLSFLSGTPALYGAGDVVFHLAGIQIPLYEYRAIQAGWWHFRNATRIWNVPYYIFGVEALLPFSIPFHIKKIIQ